jgi:hypothetical protein
MAFKLTRDPSDGTFHGETGQKVTIGCDSSAGASVVRIGYAGTEDGEAPFEFTIKKGKNVLVVIVFDNVPKRVFVTEIDGAATQNLRFFNWSPTNFFTQLTIVGD